jgi:hypothetical protein
MSHFIDSSKFIVENGVPKYSCNGLSYRDKLKNGLSFDHVFELENYCSTFEASVSVTPDVSVVIDAYEADEYSDYDDTDITFPKKRKGKWNPLKKLVASNFKKNKIKQHGYSDKLFNLEQHAKVDFDFEERKETDYDDDDSSYSNPQGYYHNHIVRRVETGEGWWYERNYHLDTWYDY